MNKEIFLGELRGYLQILEDQEQEDILEEYAQHIDIKIQKGQSEEEAIRDFGSVKELAAEILEAYHVKPGFPGEKPGNRLPELTKETAAEGKRLLGRMGRFLKGKGEACSRGIGRGYRWMRRKCRFFASWLRRLFSGKKGWNGVEKEKICEEGMDMETAGVERNEGLPALEVQRKSWQKAQTEKRGFWENISCGIGAVWKGLVKGTVVCWNAGIAFCIWGLRLVWNLAWVMAAVMFGGLAVLALAGLGMLLVLQFQGYPLVGMMLLILGGVLIFGSLSCGAFSLLIRKKPQGDSGRQKPGTEGEETAEEEMEEPEETEEHKEIEERERFSEEVRHE